MTKRATRPIRIEGDLAYVTLTRGFGAIHERKYGLQPPKIASATSSEADKKLLKDKRTGLFNRDTSQTEPAPPWRGKPGQQPDITTIDVGGVPVSLAGYYLMINGQPSVRLDKWQKAVLGELMKDYPEQTWRPQVKGMVKDIDAVIGQLRGFPLDIVATHSGWKLAGVVKEDV